MEKVELKKKIQDEILKTEQVIEKYTEMTNPVTPDVSIGRLSRLDAINNNSVTESALRQAKEKLGKLKYALSNIDAPDFGLCKRCNQPIPFGRILLRPEIPYCVSCAR